MSKPQDSPAPSPSTAYTCADYRAEMLLASLRRRRSDPETAPDERAALEGEIARLQREMGLD